MNNNDINSKALCDAIRKFSENPEAIDNFESYLSHHFDVWFNKFVTTPDGLVSEFNTFSEIGG